MNQRTIAVVVSAVFLVAVAAIFLLLWGGGEGESSDGTGDVTTTDGEGAPESTGAADIDTAAVTGTGEELVFEVRTAGQIEGALEDGELALRWDIATGDDSVWILSAKVGESNEASLISQSNGFGSSTVDDTLPGKLEVASDRVRVVLQPGELEGWPDTFEWSVQTSLDGDASEPTSALATDRFPDQGTDTFQP